MRPSLKPYKIDTLLRTSAPLQETLEFEGQNSKHLVAAIYGRDQRVYLPHAFSVIYRYMSEYHVITGVLPAMTSEVIWIAAHAIDSMRATVLCIYQGPRVLSVPCCSTVTQ